MKSDRKKAFLLGIDGATFDVIFPLIKRGKLPNMQNMMGNGAHGILQSTIPSLSAPAWVAFMTGKNPGHSGTYHFRKININDYDNIYSQDLIDSSMFRGTTFFDYLGQLGYRVGVMTIPVTYPPWEVNGFMVSGYPCPDPHENPNFAFPSELSRDLPENLNWTEKESSDAIPKEEMRGAMDPQDVLNGGLSMMSRRTAYTLKLMERFDCDVTILVWGAIDRAQHMLWKYHDPSHVLHEPNNCFKTYIEQLYCHADALLGDIMTHVGPEAHFFIVSDHGFGPKQGSRFHLNAWLNQQGYLKATLKARLMNNPLTRTLKGAVFKFAAKLDISGRKKIMKAKRTFNRGTIDFNGTLAYRFPIDEQTEGVVINLKGRQPAGIVVEEEFELLRTELIERLGGVQDTRNGRRVITRCFRREELYKGDKAPEAPDIILVLDEEYFPGAGVAGAVFSQTPRIYLETISGKHRPEGIFMAHGPDISTGKLQENAGIMDVASTVLFALGEKIPRDIEGKVLRSAFSTERLKKAPEFVDRKIGMKFDTADLSDAEQESMRTKLHDLGYL